MRIFLTIQDNNGALIRECSIAITDQAPTQHVCSDVEDAMLQLLSQWRFGHYLRLKGAEVQYVFKTAE